MWHFHSKIWSLYAVILKILQYELSMKEDESSLGSRADSGCWLNVSQGHTEKEGSLVLYFSSFLFKKKIQAH